MKVQQDQRDQMAIMSFLAGLPSEFDSAKAQILSGSSVASLQEVFSRVLRTVSSIASSHTNSSALISTNQTPYTNSWRPPTDFRPPWNLSQQPNTWRHHHLHL